MAKRNENGRDDETHLVFKKIGPITFGGHGLRIHKKTVSGFLIGLVVATLGIALYLLIQPPPLFSICTNSGNGGTETFFLVEAQRIRGIRIDLRRRALTENAGFSLWEVEIYGPDDTRNLARDPDVTARASSEQNDPACVECSAREAKDGIDYNNKRDLQHDRWSSKFFEPQWLEIILPSSQLVNRIVLMWQDAYATEYCISGVE